MNVYEEITSRILEELEMGIIPWEKPWVSAGMAVSHSTGKPYSLLNQFLLGVPGEYITFQQALKEGGHVKKGAKGKLCVFWKIQKVESEDDPEKYKTIPVLKHYHVFNVEDCEGITPKHLKELPEGVAPDEESEKLINEYITREGITLEHELGDRAYYRPSEDKIVLPEVKQFSATAEYYSTAFHEMTHSTGHSKRLNRLVKDASFGSEDYSKEELVAEIGAATLVNMMGLERRSSFRNSAAYIRGWASALKQDNKLIVSAAGKAEKAVEYIRNGVKA